MKAQAYRCLPITVLGFALLLSGLAAADESPNSRGRAGVPGRPAACPACVAAQASCTSDCFAREDKAGFGSCMMDCDNAATFCTCDEPVSLRSEDILPKPDADSVFELAPACHGEVSCQPNYPSCAGWSPFFDCGNPYCAHYKWCPDDCENEFGCYGPALRQKKERYRVCFNNLGQQCTEWNQGGGYVLSCGC